MHAASDSELFHSSRSLTFSEPEPEPELALLGLLVDELSNGILVVNVQGMILHANLAARHELERGVMMKDECGELHLLSAAAGKAFQQAREHAMSGRRSLVTLSPDDMNVTMSVIPLRVRPGEPCGHIALFLSRASVCESGVLGCLARRYSLTLTEQRVLVFLCHCLSTPEIAIEMKIAVSTVRSHVRSLCIKTSCSGVRELIQRVAVLPALRAPPLVPVH
jgi:DNA-binding CsgD family transcriptional regulator